MRDAYQIIKRPLVTEKNMSRVQTRGVYTFEVDPTANKVEIRSAIEKLFNVHVVDVHTVTMQGLEKRVGWRKSVDSNTKKALVRLKSGEKIDII